MFEKSASNDSASTAAAAYGGGITSAVTVYPTGTVSVEELSDEVPAAELAAFLKQHGLRALSVERNAILKFKRHMEVYIYKYSNL